MLAFVHLFVSSLVHRGIRWRWWWDWFRAGGIQAGGVGAGGIRAGGVGAGGIRAGSVRVVAFVLLPSLQLIYHI